MFFQFLQLFILFLITKMFPSPYICYHNTDPPENQNIKNDPTSMIIRALSKKSNTSNNNSNNSSNTTSGDHLQKHTNNNYNYNISHNYQSGKQEDTIFGSNQKRMEKVLDIFTEDII